MFLSYVLDWHPTYTQNEKDPNFIRYSYQDKNILDDWIRDNKAMMIHDDDDDDGHDHPKQKRIQTPTYYYHHRKLTKDDIRWCSRTTNTKALDEFMTNRGWFFLSSSSSNQSQKSTSTSTSTSISTSIIHLEMMADLNPTKRSLCSYHFHDIHQIRQRSNADWTWIPTFQPLSAKWMLSHHLDQYLISSTNKRFHFRSWAVVCATGSTSKSTSTSTSKRGQYTMEEALELIQKEEEERYRDFQQFQKNNLKNDGLEWNDWIEGDGYYIKPGGSNSGGGNNVHFVKDYTELKKYLTLWIKDKKEKCKKGAICLIQQAMANRRRMTWTHKNGVDTFFEMRVMVVIVGKNFESKDGDAERNIKEGLMDGSIHIFPKLRLKTLPVPKNETTYNCPILLNNKMQEKANNSAHTNQDHENKTNMFNSFSLHDLLDSIPEPNQRLWIVQIMLPQLISNICNTVKVCCFPTCLNHYTSNPNVTNTQLAKGAFLVCAFDFIVDKKGKPWLLEVNVKPWLRWVGVNTKLAYPHKLAREIASDVLEHLLLMIELSKRNVTI